MAARVAASVAVHGPSAIADVVDETRCMALSAAGYSVHEALLPETFTARNRLILARVGGTSGTTLGGQERQELGLRRGPGAPAPPSAPPSAPSRRQRALRPAPLRLPLGNDPASRALCSSASGRAAAAVRQLAPPPYLDVSMWLPDDPDDERPREQVT